MSQMTAANQDHAATASSSEAEVLSFELDGETFALEAMIVREILDMTATTAVPGAKRFAAAVINFRGKVIPLADLRIAFGMEAKPATIESRIVVIEIAIDGAPTLIGLLTDRVNEVTTLDLSRSEAPPAIGMRYRPEFIHGLVRRNGGFVILPELSAIFSTTPRAGTTTIPTAA
jgi:purine-binding chemotaxis protein CheW